MPAADTKDPEPQNAARVLMVRPASFGWNPQTAASNAFQSASGGSASTLQQSAVLSEFDALADALGKPVDLLNVREVSTVFQKEIVHSGRRLYCTDENAVAEFEMLTLSHYQKLNEERKAILDSFEATGRAYAV